jgi:nitrogen fixation protein NifU and related proteins
MAYSDQVVKRFEAVLADPQKHSVGKLDRNNPKVATGLAGAPACGDVMQLQLLLDDDERIVDVKFKTYGCGSAIASSSLFVDMMMGLTIEEAKLIKDKDIAEVLDLPPIKLHCSVLAEDAIKQAMVDYESKQTKDYTHPILDQGMMGHNGPPKDK